MFFQFLLVHLLIGFPEAALRQGLTKHYPVLGRSCLLLATSLPFACPAKVDNLGAHEWVIRSWQLAFSQSCYRQPNAVAIEIRIHIKSGRIRQRRHGETLQADRDAAHPMSRAYLDRP
jgi:hypothetical protein